MGGVFTDSSVQQTFDLSTRRKTDERDIQSTKTDDKDTNAEQGRELEYESSLNEDEEQRQYVTDNVGVC